MGMRLRVMTKTDVPAGLRLNELARWNQTADDWHRFMEASPAGCFVAEESAKVCGTRQRFLTRTDLRGLVWSWLIPHIDSKELELGSYEGASSISTG
jgi:hypothetical protein